MNQIKTLTPALDKAARIFEYLHHHGGATFSMISQDLGLPKSTTSSMLASLVAHGLLRQEQSSYYLGLRWYEYGSKVESELDIKRLALEPLTKLRDATDLTCHLGVLEGSAAVYLLKLESSAAIVIRSWVGKSLSLYSSGLGKALLAWLPEAEVDNLLPEDKFVMQTKTSIPDKTQLKKELKLTKHRGWAFDNAEDSDGVYCVAAPVFDVNGKVVAAISASGISFQVNKKTMPLIARKVVETASEISGKLKIGIHENI